MRENDGHALIFNDTNGACYVASLRGNRRDIGRARHTRSPILRLTLELVTVGDFALPVAGLFVHVKGQSAGTRDLLQAGPCTPAGAGTENKGCLRESKLGKKTWRSLTLELITVLHVRLPVAGLPLDVEREARRAPHRRQPGHADLGGFVAPKVIPISKIFSQRAALFCAKQLSAEYNYRDGTIMLTINKRKCIDMLQTGASRGAFMRFYCIPLIWF